jgi:hypothetical protein
MAASLWSGALQGVQRQGGWRTMMTAADSAFVPCRCRISGWARRASSAGFDTAEPLFQGCWRHLFGANAGNLFTLASI